MMTEHPTAGVDDGAIVFPVRVYYEDTDAAGLVYYANYLKFAERARTEMLRALGWEQRAMMADDDVAFVVRRCVADYVRPARLDDALSVFTRLTMLRGASFEVEQVVRREGVDLVRLGVTLACMTGAGRPRRIPPRLRSAMMKRSDIHDRKG